MSHELFAQPYFKTSFHFKQTSIHVRYHLSFAPYEHLPSNIKKKTSFMHFNKVKSTSNFHVMHSSHVLLDARQSDTGK
jgi:hypothetical protein